VKHKVALRQKKLRTHTNGKCNDVSTADENKEKYHCRAIIYKV
jgi:hypothetical protein